MEIEASLFNVLVNWYALKENPAFKFNESGKSVVLDSSATKFMDNGLTVAKFLTYITLFLEKQLGDRIGVNIDKLQTLKVNSSSQARLYNWNILAQELEMFDIYMSNEEKRDIVQGDHQAVINLLIQMKEVLHGDVDMTMIVNKTREADKENDGNHIGDENPENNQNAQEVKKNKIPKAAIDINKIQTEKQPNECSSWVEFILLTLSQSLKLTPKQAAAFLAKENQYLNEAWVKGLKNGYEPMIDWYQTVYGSSRHLSNLIKEEIEDSSSVLFLVMNTLKCGLKSKSDTIVEWTVKLLSKM